MLFLNRSFDKKRLKALLLWFRLNLSEGAALKVVEILQELGFRSATQGAISLGLDDLKTPPSKGRRVFQAQLEVALAHHEHHRGNRTPVELFQHLVDTWHRTSQDLTTEVVQLFHSTERVNPVYMMAFSGARGNISQVRQLVGMRGLMADPRGQIVGFPILSNFREGLTITEYFVSCYGARKGVVDTAIRTADAGYLTRRLADVSHHVVVRTANCGTHRSIQLRDIKEGGKTVLSLASRLVGRVLAEHIPLSSPTLGLPSESRGRVTASHDGGRLQMLPSMHSFPKTGTDSRLSQHSSFASSMRSKGIRNLFDPRIPCEAAVTKEREEQWKGTIAPQGRSNGQGAMEAMDTMQRSSKQGVKEHPLDATVAFVPKVRKQGFFEQKNDCGAKQPPYFQRQGMNASATDFKPRKGFEAKQVICRNSEITPLFASKLASQHVKISVRSPLSCSLPWGVCQLCYGWGLSEGRRVTLGEAVGIIAAQSIGEPGTQLTLRTFHTGGVFSGELLNEIRAPFIGTILFPKPLQGLLLRTPHGQIAFLAKVSGKMKIYSAALVASSVLPSPSPILSNRETEKETALDCFLLAAQSESFHCKACPTEGMHSFPRTGSKIERKALTTQNTNASSFPSEAEEEALSFSVASQGKSNRKGRGNGVINGIKSWHDESFISSNQRFVKGKQDQEFVIQPSTVIFVRQKEQVYQNQLLAEFSSSTLQSADDQIEITQQVLSETAGQVWFKKIDYGNRKGSGSGSLGTHFSSQDLGGIWVLAGKPMTNLLTLSNRQLFPIKPPTNRGNCCPSSLQCRKLTDPRYSSVAAIGKKGKGMLNKPLLRRQANQSHSGEKEKACIPSHSSDSYKRSKRIRAYLGILLCFAPKIRKETGELRLGNKVCLPSMHYELVGSPSLRNKPKVSSNRKDSKQNANNIMKSFAYKEVVTNHLLTKRLIGPVNTIATVTTVFSTKRKVQVISPLKKLIETLTFRYSNLRSSSTATSRTLSIYHHSFKKPTTA